MGGATSDAGAACQRRDDLPGDKRKETNEISFKYSKCMRRLRRGGRSVVYDRVRGIGR